MKDRNKLILGIVIIILMILFYAGVIFTIQANRPPITILSENIYLDLTTGGQMLVVEYAIAGHAYAVTFRGNQEAEYFRFKEHLSKAGRIE
jgi:hypothetical protein